MKRSLLSSVLLIIGLCGLPSTAARGQLPEIIGRSKGGQQSGGLIIEPGQSRSRTKQEVKAAFDESRSSKQDRTRKTNDGLTVRRSRKTDWFAILFDGKAVGYESVATTIETPLSESAITRIRRQRDTRLQLKRFGSDLSVSAVLETEESSDGLLNSWSLRRTAADGARVERTGRWDADRSGYDLGETVAGIVREQFVPATQQPRSPILNGWIAAASSGPDARWGTPVLFPETNSIADIDIAGRGSQQMVQDSGKQLAVTRFDYWPSDSPENKSSVFYDEQGAVVRVEQPLLGQTLVLERAETAGALGQKTLDALDLEFSVLVPMIRPIPQDETRQSLTLKFVVGVAEHLELPATEYQSVEYSAPGEVTVQLTAPVIFEKLEKIARPSKIRIDPEFKDSSRWIKSDDEAIKRMGVMVAGNSVLPEDKCRRLTDYVFQKMRNSAFSTSLTPASDVVKTMSGDCTEYAVLLASLMRSQGVPSRVVVGLVYVPNPASFAPHMWTEAFIDDKWVPFDATRGALGVGMTHVKVADSSLSDDLTSGTELFVPLLPLLGRTKIDYVQPSDFGSN